MTKTLQPRRRPSPQLWFIASTNSGIPSSPEKEDVRGGDLPEFFSGERLRKYRDRYKAIMDLSPGYDVSGTGGNGDVANVVVEAAPPPYQKKDVKKAPKTVPEMISAIRASLSLQMKEIASILQVERPTVYSWVTGQARPQDRNDRRIREVFSLAKKWNLISRLPLGEAIREKDHDGKSIVDQMKQERIPTQLVMDLFRSIAEKEKPSDGGIRELARKHGIDLSHVRDQESELDLVTGKRNSME